MLQQTNAKAITSNETQEPTQVVAAFAAQIDLANVPEHVRSFSKNLLLDALACALAGHAGEEVPQVTAFADVLSPGNEYTIIGGHRHSLASATLLNAFLITAVTMCDAHRPTQTHVTPAVVPATLAIAERDNVSGAEFLSALIAGYEVTTRVGIGLDFRSFRERGFHAPGILGPFGAAAAVGRLRRFDADMMARGFGLSGSQAAGTYAAWGTPTVKFHQCRGALSGLMAALLAEQGFVATREFLSAADGGLYTAYSSGGHLDRVTGDLGERWELEQIALREWPASSQLQGLITAVFDLIEKSEIRFKEVASVRIEISKPAFDLHGNYANYSGKFEAMLSGHYAAAAVLHDRDLSLDQFTPERYNAPELRKFITEHVSVKVNDRLSGAQATVELGLSSGKTISTTCLHPRGAPENPMSTVQVETKFRRYAEPYLTPAQINVVLQSVASLERLSSVRTLTDALRREV